MRSFIKSLFGRSDDNPTRLSHPSALGKGDIVKVANHFGLPEDLRNQEMRVVAIYTTQFEHEFYTGFSLESAVSQEISLTVTNDAGRESLVFSKAVTPEQVGLAFDLDEFAQIFDGDQMVTLTTQNIDAVPGWLGNTYHQVVKEERGYYYARDFRGSAPPTEEGEGEPFDGYELNAGEFGIEIEVYETGETDVALVYRCPLTMIEDLFPSV